MYTSVEQCVIKPHERELYQPKRDYPQVVIMMHHLSYYQLAHDIGLDDQRLSLDNNWPYQKHNLKLMRWGNLPIALVWASDTSEEAVNRLMEQYFWGAKTIINIGAAGGIDPELALGDNVVGERAIRNNRTMDNIASPGEEALSDPQLTESILLQAKTRRGVKRGTIWSVNNMMYSWEEYEAVRREYPLAVEIEMAPVCLTAGWLNFNYEKDYGKLAVGNLFYISDLMPQSPQERWKDTMNDMQLLTPYKAEVLLWAIRTLAEIG